MKQKEKERIETSERRRKKREIREERKGLDKEYKKG